MILLCHKIFLSEFYEWTIRSFRENQFSTISSEARDIKKKMIIKLLSGISFDNFSLSYKANNDPQFKFCGKPGDIR